MTQDQIREIVIMTIDELTNRNLIRTDNYQSVLKSVEHRLTMFFNNKGDGNGVSYALRQLSDDPYIDIIFFQYRDNKTLEWLAEYFGVDVSTVKRNKKRLILKIFMLLEV